MKVEVEHDSMVSHFFFFFFFFFFSVFAEATTIKTNIRVSFLCRH